MLVLAAVCLCVLAAGFPAGAAPSGLLHLAPALVLGIALLARRYPGERCSCASRDARRGHRCARRSSRRARAAGIAALIARGGC